MPRAILGCGAVIDTILSGISLLGGGSWLTTVIIGVLTIVSPLIFAAAKAITDAFEHPEVMPPIEEVSQR